MRPVFHAIVLHSTFPAGEIVQLHSRHRTQAAAARALSKGISAARTRKPGPGYNTWCAVVTPDNAVLSLRQAQGKMDGAITWDNLRSIMQRIAAQPV